jgi:hypothetical protein
VGRKRIGMGEGKWLVLVKEQRAGGGGRKRGREKGEVEG